MTKNPPQGLWNEQASVRPLVTLIENDQARSSQLCNTLQDAGFEVQVLDSVAACHVVLVDPAQRLPDAVVFNLMLFKDALVGFDLLNMVCRRWSSCPPVLVISAHDDLNSRLAALRAGASRYLTVSASIVDVLNTLESLTERVPMQPYRVLMVDGDSLLRDAQAKTLREKGMEVYALAEALRMLEAVDSFNPDVVLLDVCMPEASGFELAAVLREREHGRDLPVLFLSDECDLSEQFSALNLGDADFLVKPVLPGHLVSAVMTRANRARKNSVARKRIQSMLYEREREHLALDQHAIVSIADARGKIVYVNDRFCEISGYDRHELLGCNHRIINSGHHSSDFFRAMWRAIAHGDVWHGEICNRRKDGCLYWVVSTITPFMDDSGRPYQYVSIRTDISRVKYAEQAVEIHKERLRRGQMYANIGTWDWNIVSGELLWTERIGSLFGYADGELETSYDNFLRAIHPDDQQTVIDAVNACIEHDIPYDIEHRVIWPNGTVRWLLERGAVLRDENGCARQMLGVVQDIDDRKRAELALIEARDEADRANRAKSDFLSSMSHELRTPMNAILGFAQLLDGDDSLEPEQRDNAGEIIRAGGHLMNLINEVLDLAKVESGRIDLSMEPVDLSSLGDECRQLISPLATRFGIVLSIAIDDNVTVFADRIRLKQVLLNLLSNAVKYNRIGGDVRMTAQACGNHSRIVVSDTGSGIAPERIGELFLPFHRLGADRSAIEGTGIGLSITNRLVDLMGGEIGVSSTLGVGSTFWVIMAMAPTNSPTETGISSAGGTLPDRMPNTESTVLVIDDNPTNLKLVVQILGKRPQLRVLTANTADLGIELAQTHPPNLILLDINLPGMDGYQMLRIFQASALLCKVPVIAITANAMPCDIERGLDAGFVAYLAKPVDIPRFLETVDSHIYGLMPGVGA